MTGGLAELRRDQRPRPSQSEARLARLPAAFVPRGTVTAGNSCGVSDGAAAVAVVSESPRARYGWRGLRIVDWRVACVDALGLDEEVVCSDGGALALGHPREASGAILMVRLFSRMIRAHAPGDGPRFGLAACAIGGGMGVATLVERTPE